MPVRAPRPLRRRGAGVLVALVVVASGCGSASVAELPPPAGPRASPPLTVAPAGRVVKGRTLAGGAVVDRDDPGRGGGFEAGRGGRAAGRAEGRARVRVDGGRTALVLGRERVVELRDDRTGATLGRAGAGVGPTRGVSKERWLWVADTEGDALLVFRVRPKLELVRRVFLAGGPYAIAIDEEKARLWVTLTGSNEVVELPAHGRPSELRRFPTVRQPDAIAVDSVSHRVSIGGRESLQLLDPPPLVRRR